MAESEILEDMKTEILEAKKKQLSELQETYQKVLLEFQKLYAAIESVQRSYCR